MYTSLRGLQRRVPPSVVFPDIEQVYTSFSDRVRTSALFTSRNGCASWFIHTTVLLARGNCWGIFRTLRVLGT